MSEVRKLDYEDATGIPRRVLVPSEANGIDPSEGIPLSIDLSELYGHMPAAFQKRLYDNLFAQGLIEPADYLQPSAPERIRAALLATVKYDVMDILTAANHQNAHS